MKKKLTIIELQDIIDASVLFMPYTLKGYTGVCYTDVFNHDYEVNYAKQEHEY